MSEDCIFCKIVNKSISANIIYEDDTILAFHDINPQAPLHILLIPKTHIATLNDTDVEHQMLLGKLIVTAKNLAEQHNVAEAGYRILMNCNQDGGQTVFHIHLHLLAGRAFSWPPG